MSRPAFRPWRSRVLLGLTVPAAMAVVGCDTAADKADRQVDASLRQASAGLQGSPPEQAKARVALDAAVKQRDASLPQQIRANAMLASAELRQATDLSAAVLTNAADVDRLAGEVAALTRAVAADNQLVAALGQYEPGKVLAAIKDQTDAIQGSDEKPDWVKSDDGTLAATVPTDKLIAALQGQVSQLQQQVKAESDQRNDLLGKADQFNQQSERAKRQASLDLFTQGSDARKQAADLAVKIDQDDAALARAQADLAVQTAEQDGLKGAAKGADQSTSEANQNWAAVQDQIKQVKAHSAAVLGDPADARGVATIDSRAAALAAKLKVNAGLRDEAETHFNNAITFYTDAAAKATQLKTTLSEKINAADRPERADKDAWAAEKSAMDPAELKYLMATAQLDRADFWARAAAESKGLADQSATERAVLDKAGLTVPPLLEDTNGEASVATQKVQATAGAAFKAAVDNLTNLTEGDAPVELKHGAQAELMLAQYGWSLLEASNGDAAEAGNHLALATTARDAAVADNAPLPPVLPAALAAPTAAATPGGGPAMPPAAPTAAPAATVPPAATPAAPGRD